MPDAEVTADPVHEPALVAALDAVRAGRWEPAAALVAETFGDWDRRYAVVRALGDEAAAGDGWLTAWREARPDDGDAAAVHAEALVRVAARTPSDGGFAQAEQSAAHAADLCPADPTPWVTAVVAARAQGREDLSGPWAELVQRAPHHRAAHVEALRNWSGSREEVVDFACLAASESPELRFLPLAAAVGLERADRAVWRSPIMRGALGMLLVHLADQEPDAEALLDDRGLAARGLVANGRHAEAVDQLRLIGPHARTAPWRDSADPRLAFLRFRAKACAKAAR